MSYSVYILKSERTGKYYIGSTGDLKSRLRRHNQGRSTYTKRGIPWQVVYTEQFETRADAVKRERQIKKRKSVAYLKQLIESGRA
jgi:putative endonuclease